MPDMNSKTIGQQLQAHVEKHGDLCLQCGRTFPPAASAQASSHETNAAESWRIDRHQRQQTSAASAPVVLPPDSLFREALVAARDAMAAFGKQAGWLPQQQGYSCTMTQAEKDLADAVASVDAILAAAPGVVLPERTPLELAEKLTELALFLDDHDHVTMRRPVIERHVRVLEEAAAALRASSVSAPGSAVSQKEDEKMESRVSRSDAVGRQDLPRESN